MGLDYALFSLEGGVIVLGSPRDLPDVVTVVRFDEPGELRSTKVNLDDLSLVRRHLVWIEKELHSALQLFRNGRSKYLALRLSDLTAREIPPEILYRHFAVDGLPGIVYPHSDAAFLFRESEEAGLVVNEGQPRVPFAVQVPQEAWPPAGEIITLAVANSRFCVFTWGIARTRVGSTATTPMRILDRSTNAWHDLNLPGGRSTVRGFGEWLAAGIREFRTEWVPSPGEGRAARRVTGPSFDVDIQSLKVYSPGVIFLYHMPTQRRVVEETGQGDTEVVWVKDDKVLYRCDRVLYEARIEGTRLVDRRKLIERDFIADVHWVFYGPPSDPPPDPPWQPFRDL